MANKYPIVTYNGKIQEVRNGDELVVENLLVDATGVFKSNGSITFICSGGFLDVLSGELQINNIVGSATLSSFFDREIKLWSSGSGGSDTKYVCIRHDDPFANGVYGSSLTLWSL